MTLKPLRIHRIISGQAPGPAALPNTDARKWYVRKIDGLWYVWRPHEHTPIVNFPGFPSGWQPDCQRFLRGYCSCRFECPY